MTSLLAHGTSARDDVPNEVVFVMSFVVAVRRLSLHNKALPPQAPFCFESVPHLQEVCETGSRGRGMGYTTTY